MTARKNLCVFDLNLTADENSRESIEAECGRKTERMRRGNSPTLSDGSSFGYVTKRKRGQTLLRPNETRSALYKRYQSDDYMKSGSVELFEETKARASDSKLLECLLEVVTMELKVFNAEKPDDFREVVESDGYMISESVASDKKTKAIMELKVSNAKKIKNHNESAELPDDLREVVERKGGKNLKLVITKYITATDLNEKNSRFQIPERQIVSSNFLSQEEKETLKRIHEENKTEKKREGMDAMILVAPSLEEHSLKLREWPMNNNTNYVLVTGWNSVIKKEKDKKDKGIKEGDLVQLWSFRCDDDHKPWFLLHKV